PPAQRRQALGRCQTKPPERRRQPRPATPVRDWQSRALVATPALRHALRDPPRGLNKTTVPGVAYGELGWFAGVGSFGWSWVGAVSCSSSRPRSLEPRVRASRSGLVTGR